MDGMTSEERFDHIERNLVLATSTLVTVTAAQGRLTELVSGLATSIDKYVVSADKRMALMEANLDNLIRIITAEHSNGKSKH